METVRHGDTETRGHGEKNYSPRHRVTASWEYSTKDRSLITVH